jgi:hypothetical protein
MKRSSKGPALINIAVTQPQSLFDHPPQKLTYLYQKSNFIAIFRWFQPMGFGVPTLRNWQSAGKGPPYHRLSVLVGIAEL